MDSVSKWIRYDEAAKHLHITPETLRHWVSRQRVPHKKIGGRVLFSPDELNSWINSSHRGPKVL
jgi:excisionase family DNA binding protein